MNVEPEASPAAPSHSASEIRVSVLVLSPLEEDHVILGHVFSHTNWEVHYAYDFHEALDCLREHPVSVVLCERDLRDRSWKDVLNRLSVKPGDPTLVVACQAADSSTWAEVLNLGGYDVLAKPFRMPEVVWVVAGAWQQWRRRCTGGDHIKRASATLKHSGCS